MGITDKLFGKQISEAVQAGIEAQLPAIREELEKQQIAEATSSEASGYAFQHLSGSNYNPGSYELPQAFQEIVIRDSHWQYEAHGLGYIIIARIVSLIFEGGLQYAVEFDDGVPVDLQAAIRKRLDLFFYNEDVDLQDRAQEFVIECLLSGEHGWRLFADADNGAVTIADVCRADVGTLNIDPVDKRKLVSIELKPDPKKMYDQEDKIRRTLNTVRKNGRGFLEGDLLYYRLDTRASKKRGSPIMQRIVDELKAEKRFRIQGSDRMIQRLATFLSVTLKGASLKQVQEYAKAQPKSIPSGSVWYQNDQMMREFLSANLEAGDIAKMIEIFFTIIAGMMGMPVSWFGFGSSTNRATADSQQEPAAQDSRKTKRGLFGLFEKLMYYALDQALLHGVITQTPDMKIPVTDVDGNPVEKALRECITITVSPVPLAEKQPDGKPLEATTAALAVITSDDARSDTNGAKLLSPENEVALMNYALARDGVGIEVVKQEEAEVPVEPQA